MESLMLALESYEDKYIQMLIANLEVIIKRAKFWVLGLFYGILNNKEYYEILKKKLTYKLSKAIQNSLFELFQLIEKESPHHRELIAELRQELEKI